MALAPALKAFLDRPAEARRLGPFHLLHQLGRGSFAPVWLAREVYGDVEIRRAAVKLFAFDSLPPGAPGGSETRRRRERVLEEARLLGQVEHPNIVRLYRLLPEEEEGIVAMAMEYADGASLEHRLAAQGKLPIDQVLSIGAAVASALSAVHRAGLVHRDVKPANVVEAAGVIKLIDFGIASAGERRERAPERSGVRRSLVGDLPPEVMGENMSLLGLALTLPDGTSPADSDGMLPSGTVGYIDPVCVAEGVAATSASDLYALGATLFECITGYCPSVVAAGPGGGMKGEVLDGRAPSPRLLEVVPTAPLALGQLIDALLSPKREQRPASAERVAIELERLRAERAGRARALPPESVGPFRGLGRFESSDRDVYFGRSAETAAALEMLRSRGLVALVGASGSGKSSLARAGVAPLVAEGGLGGWIKAYDVCIAVPGVDPRAAIVSALVPLVPEAERLGPDALVSALARRAEKEGRGTLLVIDQLEEMVTLLTGRSVPWAAELLAKIADPLIPGVRALVTVRRDLLDPLLAIGDLGRVLPRGLFLVTPMSDVAWEEVIDQALAAYGYRFEVDLLRDKLMQELKATTSAMPLVQFALTELWEQRDRANKTITWAGFEAIGGLEGALEKYADATLQRLTQGEPLKRDAARQVLLSMTTPQGTRATRTTEQIARDTTAPGVRGIVRTLEEARLVVREDAGVTLAHEALLTQWGTLRQWLADARKDRLLADELEQDAARWAKDKDETLLWKKRRLLAAEELGRRELLPLSAEAKEFLRQSRSAERQGRLVIGVAVAAVLASGTFTAVKYVTDIRAKNADIETKNEQIVRALDAAQENERKARESALEALRQKEVAEQRQREAEDVKQAVAALSKQYKEDLEALKKAKTLAEFVAIKSGIDAKRGTQSAPPPVVPPSPSSTTRSRVGDPFDY